MAFDRRHATSIISDSYINTFHPVITRGDGKDNALLHNGLLLNIVFLIHNSWSIHLRSETPSQRQDLENTGDELVRYLIDWRGDRIPAANPAEHHSISKSTQRVRFTS